MSTLKQDGETLVWSSGRKRTAHGGIVGIDPEARSCFNGFDGGLYQPRDLSGFEGDEWLEYDGLTPAERIELADHMLARWQKFKDEAAKEMTP